MMPLTSILSWKLELGVNSIISWRNLSRWLRLRWLCTWSKFVRLSMRSIPWRSSTETSSLRILWFMTYLLDYLGRDQTLWLRVVGLPRQHAANNILRHSDLRPSLDPKRQIVWREDRHLVTGHNDILDAGGGESFQDNKRGVVDKDSQRWDKYTFICLRFEGGARFLR